MKNTENINIRQLIKENKIKKKDEIHKHASILEERAFGKELKNITYRNNQEKNIQVITKQDLINKKGKENISDKVLNQLKNDENIDPKKPNDKVVKIGNSFVRTTSYFTNNDTFMKLKENNYPKLEKYDYEVRENPQYIVEYVKDIFDDLKKNELVNCPTIGYLDFQKDINHKVRAVLVDWLIEVHLKFKLNNETLFLTMNLIDRYLEIKQVGRNKLQLLAVGAMLIASKYEEIYAPEVRDFVYITDKSYTKEEILTMEGEILSTLNFDILSVYSITFLERFHFITAADKKSFHLAQYILELSLLEYKMLGYSPSLKAASSLYLARIIFKIDQGNCWNNTLMTQTGFKEQELKPCAKELCTILELAPKTTQLKSCFMKFSQSKFNEVAKLQLRN